MALDIELQSVIPNGRQEGIPVSFGSLTGYEVFETVKAAAGPPHSKGLQQEGQCRGRRME